MKNLNPGHKLYGRGQRLDDAEIVRLYAEIQDSELVGLRAGVSGTTVLNRVRAAGGVILKPGHTRNKKRLKTTLNDAEICRLYREGLSGPTIADRAGCSAGHVYNVLEAAKIPRRSAVEYYPALDAARKKSGRGP
jgi:hypothetical protein